MIVVRVLRKLAHTGRAIICTIHQPSKEIFACFDSLLLLKKGKCVWQACGCAHK
jgi:ABC-type multidrug transport system ATPase subunit